MNSRIYAVATIRPWHLKVFNEKIRYLPGRWTLISDPQELTVERLASLAPRYVFFPHWSWKVPKEITSAYACIAFHPTDLPLGRGGSPVQNMISSGAQETMLSAFRMSDGLDDGPVYIKRPLSLAGSAQEIFERTAALTAEMISEIVANNPVPQEQRGTPTFFKRRTPAMSALPVNTTSLVNLYDHIRMLDAEEYPRAFLVAGNVRITFSKPVFQNGELTANVSISLGGEE